MKQPFIAYLKDIGMAEPLIERVSAIYDFYTKVLEVDIEHILVTDTISEDNTRSFDSVWFFTAMHCLEAHRFVHEDSFDFSLTPRFVYWRAEKTSYDFEKATTESRMKLTISSETITGELRASGKNCDYLRDVLLKWILPRSLPDPTHA